MADVTASRNPAYDAWRHDWSLMRAAYEGEAAIKAAGETYLPMPGGFRGAPNEVMAYKAYVDRAVFPEVLEPTVRGMSGVMHAKPATYDLPTALEGMREWSTRDGLPLDGLHRRITREVLQVGRIGCLVDLPAEGADPRPYVATYRAEAILDWEVDDFGRLSFVMLDETGMQRDPDTGTWIEVKAYRILSLDEAGFYVSRRVQKAVDAYEQIAAEPVRRGGQRLTFIPFVFIDTNDLTPDPDEIPLLPLARVAIQIYRLEADYRRALFLTAQPTPVIIGAGDIGDDATPMTIGAAVPWLIPQGGDAKFLEFSGASVGAQRQAIRDDMERAVQLGARLLSEQTGREESGEARRLRYASESATLTSIAQNVASGLERALRYAAEWIGADPDDVDVKPNLDFAPTKLSPQDIDALVRSWMAGAFSYQTLFSNLQRGGVIADDVTAEDERERLDTEPPRLGGEPMDLS